MQVLNKEESYFVVKKFRVSSRQQNIVINKAAFGISTFQN